MGATWGPGLGMNHLRGPGILPALGLLVPPPSSLFLLHGRIIGISPPQAQAGHDFTAQVWFSLWTGTEQEPVGVSTEGIRMSYFGEHFWVSKTHFYFDGGLLEGLWGLLWRWGDLAAYGQSLGQVEGLRLIEIKVGGVGLGLNLYPPTSWAL